MIIHEQLLEEHLSKQRVDLLNDGIKKKKNTIIEMLKCYL